MNGFISLCHHHHHHHAHFSSMGLGSEEIALIGVVASVAILWLVSLWRLFEKAGRPGWAALIPGYNAYVVTQIAGRSGWWTLGFFIPFVDIFTRVVIGIDIAQKFDRSAGFGIGLALFSFAFLPMLAFSKAQYMEAVPPSGYRTFINEEGDLVEEVPLEDWGNEEKKD